MEQTKRIRQMEHRLDHVSKTARQLSAILDKLPVVQEDIRLLSEYYGSEEWKQDFADDEAGRLPKNLKRGVLSEDGIWNVLSDWKELKERLMMLPSDND